MMKIIIIIKTKVCKVSETLSDMKNQLRMSEPKTKKNHKYLYSYIKFGFIFNVKNGEPQCVIYLERLASESMKLSKPKQHLVTSSIQT